MDRDSTDLLRVGRILWSGDPLLHVDGVISDLGRGLVDVHQRDDGRGVGHDGRGRLRDIDDGRRDGRVLLVLGERRLSSLNVVGLALSHHLLEGIKARVEIAGGSLSDGRRRVIATAGDRLGGGDLRFKK